MLNALNLQYALDKIPAQFSGRHAENIILTLRYAYENFSNNGYSSSRFKSRWISHPGNVFIRSLA